MTLKLSSLKADLKKRSEGDWIAYPDWPGVRFHVSSFSSPAWRQASGDLLRRFAKKYDDGKIPDDELYKANGALLAEYILHGWDGIDEPYTPELALERLTDPAYEALNIAIHSCAGRCARIDAEFLEQAGKNSEAPSATS